MDEINPINICENKDQEIEILTNRINELERELASYQRAILNDYVRRNS